MVQLINITSARYHKYFTFNYVQLMDMKFVPGHKVIRSISMQPVKQISSTSQIEKHYNDITTTKQVRNKLTYK